MFQLVTGDFKLMFEYDTVEELIEAKRAAMEIQLQLEAQRFQEVKEHIQSSAERVTDGITFEILRDKFVARKNADNIVSADSIIAYNTTFKMLIKFFKEAPINQLHVEDFESWKDSMVKEGGRSNRTINKHINYAKNFLNFAEERQLISHNNVQPVTILDEVKDKQKRKQQVENFSQKDINEILNYEYKDPIFNKIMKIALYTAMRQNEINALTQEDIVKDKKSGIYYFNITNSKSVAGIRKVPIHKDILDMVLNTSFPLIPDLSKQAFSKKSRYQLYKTIDKGHGKNFHTCRGTFIQRAIEANKDRPNSIFMIQEIVGHDKGESALTLDTYGKGFELSTLKEIMDRVSF